MTVTDTKERVYFYYSLTSYYLTGYWLKEALERVLIRMAMKTALKSGMFVA